MVVVHSGGGARVVWAASITVTFGPVFEIGTV